MNGQKYDYSLYEYEPVVEEFTSGYFVKDTAPAPVHEQALAQTIVGAPTEGMLFRPVSEVFSAARGSINDSVLSKPVGELLTSARESLNDSVLSRPVREVFGPTAARRRRRLAT